ncbi:MAG TPA: carbohydrate-binding family 6 protein [Opitutaceae bacterium]
MSFRTWAFSLFVIHSTAGFLAGATPVTIHVDPQLAPALFAADEIAAALTARNEAVSRAGLDGPGAPSGEGRHIVLAPLGHPIDSGDPSLASVGSRGELAPDGFVIQREGSGGSSTIRVLGGGPGGVMYGGLEVAEQIALQGFDAVAVMTRNPRFAMRGTKFNIPLDVRTPSYTDMGDSAQANIGEVWNLDFWKAYLDRLALDRFNFVSLWNLHPFPSMVKVPEYPDIALDDVQRSAIMFDEDYSTRTTDVVTPAMLAEVETVRKMTIDEKIEFWRRVMQYGRERNIDFYVVTWNIYTYGTDGRYGITDAIDNPVTIDYFRKSVAQLFRTYPLLRGIGFTAGENMGESSFDAKENWAFATYGKGVLDVAREQPGRKIRFIHRQHETHAQDIAATFAPLSANPDIDFIFSFKYAQAHVMSSTTQTFHRDFVASLGNLKTVWTLRNDDALMFRWGAPDFVREFISNIPAEVTQGMYYGSDMWVWGREFLSLDPDTPRQLEIEKHWYDWMLWGRLSYDPTLGNDRIVALLGRRYPEVEARMLFDAWQHASMIYPLTTGFHWGQFDFQWYIEGCRSRPEPAQTASGFHDVNRFITLGTHPGTDNLTIPQYVERLAAGDTFSGTTPLEVSAQLHGLARAARHALEALQPGANKELRRTLPDIRAMSFLGSYYAEKIAGATALAVFRADGSSREKEKAIQALTKAAGYWRQYTELAASLYKNPMWTNRVGHVDWSELSAEVARDIAIAREAKPPGKR